MKIQLLLKRELKIVKGIISFRRKAILQVSMSSYLSVLFKATQNFKKKKEREKYINTHTESFRIKGRGR